MIDEKQIPDEACLGLLHALLGNPQPTPQTVRAVMEWLFLALLVLCLLAIVNEIVFWRNL
jgi:hypothetical protein